MILKSGFTEQINKIVLSSNYDKRLQTFDKITGDVEKGFKEDDKRPFLNR